MLESFFSAGIILMPHARRIFNESGLLSESARPDAATWLSYTLAPPDLTLLRGSWRLLRKPGNYRKKFVIFIFACWLQAVKALYCA